MTLPVFPQLPGMAWPLPRTVIYSTNVQKSVSGKTTRIGNWIYPIYQWEMKFNLLRSDNAYLELQTMFAFFNAAQGQANLFAYQDKDDNAVTNQLIGTGDGNTTIFQLVRAFGGFTQPIAAPNVITQVTINGVPTTAYTVSGWGSATPGCLIFAQAPAAGAPILVTFSYYFVCAFSDDTITFETFAMSRYRAQNVKIESVK